MPNSKSPLTGMILTSPREHGGRPLEPKIAGIMRAVLRRGATVLRHSGGRPFLEHLVGTWRILARWKQPPVVCRAGLLHSAYATQLYPYALFRLNERDRVRKLIGREAEALVFAFCTLDRITLKRRVIASRRIPLVARVPELEPGDASRVIDRETIVALLLIEVANTAEQAKDRSGAPDLWMSDLSVLASMLNEHLSAPLPIFDGGRAMLSRRSEAAALRAYFRGLALWTDEPRRAAGELARASRHNPWIGEPILLRGLAAEMSGQHRNAMKDAHTASALFRAWGLAWDKRASWEAWTDEARRLAARSERAVKRNTVKHSAG